MVAHNVYLTTKHSTTPSAGVASSSSMGHNITSLQLATGSLKWRSGYTCDCTSSDQQISEDIRHRHALLVHKTERTLQTCEDGGLLLYRIAIFQCYRDTQIRKISCPRHLVYRLCAFGHQQHWTLLSDKYMISSSLCTRTRGPCFADQYSSLR